jgi:transposase InsO family protein
LALIHGVQFPVADAAAFVHHGRTGADVARLLDLTAMIQTTTALPVAENLLQQEFTAQRPNQLWVGDMAYTGTDEGWLYLAIVLDLFSRKVVGWSMSERMTASLVCDALRMALFRRKRPRGVIMHTDRGSQYCSRDHRDLLDTHGLIASMSAKGNYYDNAAMESWNHSLKIIIASKSRRSTASDSPRARRPRRMCSTTSVDYNRDRLHSTLGYVSPEQFERAHTA